jgi:integrase
LNRKGNLISPGDFNHFLKGAGLKAAITGKNPKIFLAHMFRHSRISLLAELGISQKATMERVGHSNPYTTNMIYTHVTQTMRDEVSQKLENLSL